MQLAQIKCCASIRKFQNRLHFAQTEVILLSHLKSATEYWYTVSPVGSNKWAHPPDDEIITRWCSIEGRGDWPCTTVDNNGDIPAVSSRKKRVTKQKAMLLHCRVFFVVVFCDYGVIRPQDLTMAIRPLGLFVLFVFSPKSYLQKGALYGVEKLWRNIANMNSSYDTWRCPLMKCER